MGDDENALYFLSLEDAGIPGIIFSSIVSLAAFFYVMGMVVSITWKLPKMTVEQTRALMTPNQRMVMISFLLSLLLMDFMSIHAWRILSGDGACIPTPDWFMLWASGTFLNIICLVTAWLHPPYSAALIRTSTVSSAYIVLYYLFTCLARNQFCGSVFVSIPSLVTGVTNIFVIPNTLCIDIDEFESPFNRIGRAIARVTRGPVAQDRDSLSVYYNPAELEEGCDKATHGTNNSEYETVTLDTPRRTSTRTPRLSLKASSRSSHTVHRHSPSRRVYKNKWRPSDRRMKSRRYRKQSHKRHHSHSPTSSSYCSSDGEDWTSTTAMEEMEYFDDDDVELLDSSA